MSRYIDADILIGDLIHNRSFYPAIVSSAIKNTPTADVVAVRHGHWYFVEYEYFSCSECGESYYNGCDYTAQAKEKLQNGDYYNYCPNCGAKMGGERSENGT